MIVTHICYQAVSTLCYWCTYILNYHCRARHGVWSLPEVLQRWPDLIFQQDTDGRSGLVLETRHSGESAFLLYVGALCGTCCSNFVTYCATVLIVPLLCSVRFIVLSVTSTTTPSCLWSCASSSWTRTGLCCWTCWQWCSTLQQSELGS